MAGLIEVFADVLAIDLAELAQQLLRSLVEQLRQHEPHLDDEVAAAAVAGGHRAALAEAEALAGLRPGRHAQPRRPVGGWNVDPRAERGFMKGDRDRDVEVVALPLED